MMTRLERQNRRMLKLVGLDPTRMTPAQINRAVKALIGITRCECVPGANKRRPAAVEAWRKLVDEVLPSRQEREARQRRQIAALLQRRK
jgi:hypothetical protein